jgi:hypothetical protein
MLMAIGIGMQGIDVPKEKVRQAIRLMSPDDRGEAVSWIWSYIAGNPDEKDPQKRREQLELADKLWSDRIGPWIRAVWPRDKAISEPNTSEKFAEIAIATDRQFDDAVSTLLPYIESTFHWAYPIIALAESEHPDLRPRSSLTLLARIVSLSGPFFLDKLRSVLDRIVHSEPAIKQDPSFRKLDERLRVG